MKIQDNLIIDEEKKQSEITNLKQIFSSRNNCTHNLNKEQNINQFTKGYNNDFYINDTNNTYNYYGQMNKYYDSYMHLDNSKNNIVEDIENQIYNLNIELNNKKNLLKKVKSEANFEKEKYYNMHTNVNQNKIINELKEAIKNYKKENSELKALLLTKDEKIKIINEENNVLNKKLKEIEYELNTLKDKNDKIKSEQNFLNNDIKEIRQSNSKINENNNSLLRENNILKEEINKIKKENNESKIIIDKLKSEIKILKDKEKDYLNEKKELIKVNTVSNANKDNTDLNINKFDSKKLINNLININKNNDNNSFNYNNNNIKLNSGIINRTFSDLNENDIKDKIKNNIMHKPAYSEKKNLISKDKSINPYKTNTNSNFSIYLRNINYNNNKKMIKTYFNYSDFQPYDYKSNKLIIKENITENSLKDMSNSNIQKYDKYIDEQKDNNNYENYSSNINNKINKLETKIGQLQDKVSELKEQNDDIDKDNKKLKNYEYLIKDEKNKGKQAKNKISKLKNEIKLIKKINNKYKNYTDDRNKINDSYFSNNKVGKCKSFRISMTKENKDFKYKENNENENLNRFVKNLRDFNQYKKNVNIEKYLNNEKNSKDLNDI